MQRIFAYLRHVKTQFTSEAEAIGFVVAFLFTVAAGIIVTLGAMTTRGGMKPAAILLGIASQLGLFLIESVYVRNSADDWRTRKYPRPFLLAAFAGFFFYTVFMSSVFTYHVFGGAWRARENTSRTFHDWNRWIKESDDFSEKSEVLLAKLRGEQEQTLRDTEEQIRAVTAPRERAQLLRNKKAAEMALANIAAIQSKLQQTALDVERPSSDDVAARERNRVSRASRVIARDIRFLLRQPQAPPPPDMLASDLVPDDPQQLLVYQLRPAQLRRDPTAAVIVFVTALAELLPTFMLFAFLPNRTAPRRVADTVGWFRAIAAAARPPVSARICFELRPNGDSGEVRLDASGPAFTLHDVREALVEAIPQLASNPVRDITNSAGAAIAPALPLLEQLAGGPLVIHFQPAP